MNGEIITLRNKNTGEVVKLRRKTPEQPSQPQIQPSVFETPENQMRQNLGEPLWFSNLPFVKKTDEMTENLRQRTLGAGLGAVNTGLMGLPEFISQKLTGRRLVPQKAPIAKGVGEIAGFAGGIPGKVMGGVNQGLNKAIPSMSTIPSSIKGMLTGATAGASMLPSPEEAPTMQQAKGVMGQRVGGGMALGGLVGAIAPQVTKFQKWLNPKNQLKLAEEARNSLFTQKQQQVENFGKQYDEIIKNSADKNISLGEAFKGLMENTDDAVNSFSSVKEFNDALASNNPTAKKLMSLVKSINEGQSVPINVTVKEADALQKFVKGLPGIKTKLEKGYKYGFQSVDWNNSERIMLDFANDIKASVLDTAPELKALNQSYGKFMTQYKQLRPYLKWNSAVPNIMDIHNPQKVAILDLMQRVLPQNIMKDMLMMNRTVRNAELLKMIGGKTLRGAAMGVGGYGAYKLLGRNK